ncbi:MAG: hypothetical protein E5Y65_01580 [Mesorhizobium sp.]|uniref:hypothetical protein n=1 Tax=Mesorhizobium sp. TaxID=1871066 RepID=UPI0012188E0C|nr:hypothetical protein [Mesorhizobium sp.]TIL76794.1 MAG: hypothetical protein E5Y70_00295 [Mesorhizobium sp.]TIL93732.1 MAG: hypothetical protein E5Y65_01580 [Mesorhizobium sp.]TIM02728.1 MAG: hypothetical protein E5Y64_04750 [Mesorhizobium sp.]
MIKADTPFALMLEMHAVVLGVPALILLASAAIVALIRPWRFSSSVGLACKLASGVGIMAMAVVLAQGAFLLGFGTLLEDPRYRSHFVCEPCF